MWATRSLRGVVHISISGNSRCTKEKRKAWHPPLPANKPFAFPLSRQVTVYHTGEVLSKSVFQGIASLA